MEITKKGNELVTTVVGTIVPKAICRSIAGEYYIKGDVTKKDSGHCYKINNKYYKYNTGYIKYDSYKKQYVIKNKAVLNKGIVAISKVGELEQGYYSCEQLESRVLQVPGENSYYFMDESVVKGTPYIYNAYQGCYTNRLHTLAREYFLTKTVPYDEKRNLPYDSRGHMDNLIKYHTETYNPVITDVVEKYTPILKDLTFGVEFETIRGSVDKDTCKKLGLLALRDGSIGGLEYATIPLQGKKGVQTLVNSITELKRNTEYDENCSIHFHIGNIPRTEGFFLALYKTLCILENQMYELFPLYKKYNFGVKRKHYTRPFPLDETIYQMDKSITNENITENFAVLYKYLSMGQTYSNVGNKLSNVDFHPSDPGGRSKWNIRSRYHWVNLIPLLFGNKQTVEFRLHTPTYNADKIMNYLILCASIVNFVKANTTTILKNPATLQNLSLTDIIGKMTGSIEDKNMDRINEIMFFYLRQRKDFFFRKSKQGKIQVDENSFRTKQLIPWNKGNTSAKELMFSKIRMKKSQISEYAPPGGRVGEILGRFAVDIPIDE